MAYSEWKEKTDGFKKVDVRGAYGNFLDGIKKQAASFPKGEGMEIVQTFEPIPLYEVMGKKATIAEMSKKSGMGEDVLIKKLAELIRVHS